jgi:hypothetical protein
MSELLRDRIQEVFQRENRISEIRGSMQRLNEQAKADNRGLTAKERREWDLLVLELDILQHEKENDPMKKKVMRSMVPESFYLKEVNIK